MTDEKRAILEFCKGLFAVRNLIGADFADVSMTEVEGRDFPSNPWELACTSRFPSAGMPSEKPTSSHTMSSTNCYPYGTASITGTWITLTVTSW